MGLIDGYKTVTEKLNTSAGPTCALCIKTVEKATLIANGLDNPRIRIECHGQCFTETIGPWIARDREKLYEYLSNFKSRTFFEERAREPRRSEFGSISAEAMRAIKRRWWIDRTYLDQSSSAAVYTSNTTDLPRSYQVQNVYRADTNLKPVKSVKPIMYPTGRAIRHDD